jgi:hypothetical protein
MSNLTKAAYLKARRCVLLSSIADRICDDLPYGNQMQELDKVEMAIKALGFDPLKPL